MALTITNATVPSHAGPGYHITLHTSLTGPIPADDMYLVQVDIGGNFFASGGSRANSLTTRVVQIGINPFYGQGVLEGWIAPGANVNLTCYLAHADFSVVETLVSANWLWDPTGGLYQLRQSDAGSLATILDAVRQVKTTPGQV